MPARCCKGVNSTNDMILFDTNTPNMIGVSVYAPKNADLIPFEYS